MKPILLGASLALLLVSAMPVTAKEAPRDVTDARSCDSCHGYPPAPEREAATLRGGDWADARFEDYSGGGGAHLIKGHISGNAVASEGWANCIGCHNRGEEGHARVLPIKNHLENVRVALDQRYRLDLETFAAYSGARLVSGRANRTGACFNVSCHFRPTPPWSRNTAIAKP